MISITRNGRMDQVSSSFVEPSIWVACDVRATAVLVRKEPDRNEDQLPSSRCDTTLMNQYRASI